MKCEWEESEPVWVWWIPVHRVTRCQAPAIARIVVVTEQGAATLAMCGHHAGRIL